MCQPRCPTGTSTIAAYLPRVKPFSPKGPGARPLATLVLVAAGSLALGCTSDFEQRIADYHASVREAVGAGTAGPPAPPADTAPPRRRLVRFEVESPTMGIFDLLALQGCRLGELAGYRNSPMGRVMPPTRRLRYEVEVLEVGHRCLEGTGESRRAKLEAMLAAKRQDLPRHLWNALWTTEEVEALLTATQAPMARVALADAEPPLLRVAHLVDGELREVGDAVSLEEALAQLRHVEPLGLALRRLDTLTRGLDAVSTLVAAHGRGGCGATEGRLAAAFRTQYLMGVQPDALRIDRGVGSVLEALAILYERSQAGLPLDEDVRRYHEQVLSPTAPEGVWSRYRTALRVHAAAWEPTLRTCDVLPAA